MANLTIKTGVEACFSSERPNVKPYKQQLHKALEQAGWEVVEVATLDNAWWCDEYWRIQSRREGWGLELFVVFLVDPQWEQLRKPGQGVWQIVATPERPTRWTQYDDQRPTMHLTRGRYDENVAQFIAALEQVRRQ